MNTKIFFYAQIPAPADLFMMIIYIKLVTSLFNRRKERGTGPRSVAKSLWLVAPGAKHRFSSEYTRGIPKQYEKQKSINQSFSLPLSFENR